jgi:UDP-N-acetylbacillosamine N-acetyltransferase
MGDQALTEIAIWGASGHGRVVLDAARLDATLTVVGFIDDAPALKGQSMAACPVLGGKEALPQLLSSGVRFIHVAVGHCPTRSAIIQHLIAEGFTPATIAHPRAIIAGDVVIGRGSFVAAGVVVNSGAKVGGHVILNTSASVDHDCVIGDGVHLAPGVRVGGLTSVGAGTFIGIGATVLNCLKIGEQTIVGGGAVVVDDLPAGVVAYGVPAKVVRSKRANE